MRSTWLTIEIYESRKKARIFSSDNASLKDSIILSNDEQNLLVTGWFGRSELKPNLALIRQGVP
jgi:hypothetical protein